MKCFPRLRRRQDLHVVLRHRQVPIPFHLECERAQPGLDLAMPRRQPDVRIEFRPRWLVCRIQRGQMDFEDLCHVAKQIGEVRGKGCVLGEPLAARWLFTHRSRPHYWRGGSCVFGSFSPTDPATVTMS